MEEADFDATLRRAGWETLFPAALEIFQVNIGRLCNQTCRHCHVDAGPHRTVENMDRDTVNACLRALESTPAHTVDITVEPSLRWGPSAGRHSGSCTMRKPPAAGAGTGEGAGG